MKIDGITSRLDNLENSADTDMIVEQKVLILSLVPCAHA